MIRILLIVSYLIVMIIFTVFIMTLGFKQGARELLYLGIGIPLYIYMLYFYLKIINRIELEKETVTIRNIIWGRKLIKLEEVEQWEEIYTINLFAHNLLLRVNGQKIVISNMIDSKKYELLLKKLETNYSQYKRKYK
jgi:hypothetical protein